jgi:hypothetical protein
MALIHADPFAHYSTAQLARVYPDFIEVGGTISVGAFGRDSGPGMRFDNLQDGALRNGLSEPSGAVHIQQADVRISAAPGGVNALFSFSDGATTHVTLAVDTNRKIAIYRGTVAGTLLGTSTYVVPIDTYIHIAWKVTINDTTGSVVVHVWENGDTAAQVVINLSGVDTKNTANATWDGFGFGGVTSTGNTDFCNVVVMDGSGSSCNDLLGPVDVRALFASARLTPALTDWSLSAGSSVAALLDEETADDDTTYLSETTQNEQMTVAVQPLQYPSRTIYGAQLYAAVKLASGTPTLKGIGYQSGTPNLGADFAPGASYSYLQQPYSAMPDGTAFTTGAAFDALQWGLKLTTNTTGARVTQIVVAVVQPRRRSRNNLLNGLGHTVSGDENHAAGQTNTVAGSGSEAHGQYGTVNGFRTMLFNLDGTPRTVAADRRFVIHSESVEIDKDGAFWLRDLAGDPSNLKDGHVWRDGDELKARLNGATEVFAPSAGGGAAIGVHVGTVNGRLTTESGVPISTSDRTAQGTIYFTPYLGNQIALYDGADWQLETFAELSLALSGLTSGKNYDVFVDYNGGTPQLVLGTAWTDDTTRAVALALQNGVYVLTGATDHRYVGTIRTTGTTTTEDSKAKRFVWNIQNQVRRPMAVFEATASWNYTTATWRQANAAAANQLDFVTGIAGVEVEANLTVSSIQSGVNARSVGIGLDSTTAPSADSAISFSQINNRQTHFCVYRGTPGIGRHTLVWLEQSAAAGTTTWTGDSTIAGQSCHLSGIQGALLN